MRWIVGLLRSALAGVAGAGLRLLATLVAVVLTTGLMIVATLALGLPGLLLVAVPVVLGLFVLGVLRSGSEGTSGD